MRVRNKSKKLTSEGGTHRPDDATSASGEEGGATLTRARCNDAVDTADNPVPERNSTDLRKPRNLGTWNVQGMTAGKLEIVTARMEEQSISLLGISETWWLDQERFTTENGYTVVYSGKGSGRREQGVGIIMDKMTAKSFMGFNPISSKIITMRLHGHPFNTTIVQVYAPTSTASYQDLEDFYGMLQDTLDKTHSKDMLVVMCHWNATIGQTNIKSKVVGNFNLAQGTGMNEVTDWKISANRMISS